MNKRPLISLFLALAAVSCSGVLDDGQVAWDSPCGDFATRADAPDGNNPPLVTTDYAGTYVVHAHEVLEIDILVRELDGDPFVVAFEGGSAAATSVRTGEDPLNHEASYRLTIDGSAAPAGIYHACYSAMDCYGALTEYSVGYEISENHPPVVSDPVESMLFESIGESFSINLDEHFTEPDGERLSYSFTMNSKGLLDVKISANLLSGKTYNYGRTDIVVTATDGSGLSAQMPFAVLCREKDNGVSIYPNPVRPDENGKFYLYICGGQESMTDISIYTASGSLAWSGSMLSSVFAPAVVDMTEFASGKYNVVVVHNGSTFSRSIVKL